MTVRVNNVEIPETVILAELKRLIQFYSEYMSRKEIGKQMKNLLQKAREQAIGARLLQIEAERRKIAVPPEEIEQRLNAMIKEAGGEDRFLKLLEKQKLTVELLHLSIAQGRRIDRLIQEITRSVSEPTDDEIRAHYDDHKDEFVSPPRAQARHILIKPSSENPADKAAAVSKLQELKQRAETGVDFADLAAAFSDCPSGRSAGGSLGWISKGVTLPEFDASLFSMEEGQISDIIETPLGFHLIQKISEDAPVPMDFDDVQDKIRNLLIHNRRGVLISQFVAHLRAKATIEDDGAAPSPESILP